MDIFGIQDTIGKSYYHEFEVVEIDTAQEDPTPIETGNTLKVLLIDFDSNYTFVVKDDTIAKKIDNTMLNERMQRLSK